MLKSIKTMITDNIGRYVIPTIITDVPIYTYRNNNCIIFYLTIIPQQ